MEEEETMSIGLVSSVAGSSSGGTEDKLKRQQEMQKQLEDDLKGKEILPRLYIGSRRVAQNKEWLVSNSVRYILNATREVSNFYEEEFQYKRISITDSMDENAKQYFEEASEFIRDGLAKEGSVLVHCNEGRSRCATFMIAYLLRHEKWDLKKAFQVLSERHSNINVNDGFKKQLMDFELSLGKDKPTLDFFTSRRSSLISSKEISLKAEKPLVELNPVILSVETTELPSLEVKPAPADITTAPVDSNPLPSVPPLEEPATEEAKPIDIVSSSSIQAENISTPLFWGTAIEESISDWLRGVLIQ